MARLNQPLSAGEILSTTAHIYEDRFRTALALGVGVLVTYVVAHWAPAPVGLALVLVMHAVALAIAARITAGDELGEATAQTLLRIPVLLVLGVVVFVPFVVVGQFLLLLIFPAAWLALVVFAIPVAMLEEKPSDWFSQLSRPLQRSLSLARVDYLHALGGVAVMILAYIVAERLLEQLLKTVAENGPFAAFALAQLVLAPFFFLGLSVLYFDQNARALSSRGNH